MRFSHPSFGGCSLPVSAAGCCCSHGPAGRPLRLHAPTSHPPSRVATACQEGRWLQERPHAFSRFRVQCCFHGVLRHHRHRLHWRDQAFIRKRGWLPDELPDRGDRAHNAHRVNYRFHYAPAFLFRADQEPIDRLSFLLHNFKTPRSSRFV